MNCSKPKSLGWALALTLIIVGCGLIDEPKQKNTPLGLITTPTAYYSTPKARYLGQKYKQNLDNLVERIVRHPKTANLQFANNIASVGGIGFFTHSAATVPDERYLEVVLAAPETFEVNGEYSTKVSRLFTLYGTELLSILASDAAVYQDSEVSGYGLNLSWRKVARGSEGPRVALERAIAYFPKQSVRGFLRQEMSQNEFLKGAIIFAVEEDGPMSLVSYRPPEPKPDFRPPIQEETLASARVEPKSDAMQSSAQPSSAENVQVRNVENITEHLRKPELALNEQPPLILQPPPMEKREESKSTPLMPEKRSLPPVAAEKAKQKIPVDKKSSGLATPADKNRESLSQSANASVTPLEVSPPVSAPIVRRTQESPLMPPTVDARKEVELSEATQSRNEPSSEKSTEPMVKPPSPEGKPLIANIPRAPTVVPPSTNAPAVNERVKETKAQEELANPAKTPGPSVPLGAAKETKSEPVVVASKQVAKAPAVGPGPKNISDAKEENLSESGSTNATVVKAETTKAPDQLKAVEQSKPAAVTVAPKPVVKASAVVEPASQTVEAKEETVSETKSQNPIVAKAETVKAPDQPKSIEQRKPQPVIANSKPEIKAPAVAQPAPTKVTQPTEENVTLSKPQSAEVEKAQTVKLSDQPKRVEEKKPELGVAGSIPDVKADAKPQSEIVVKEKTAEPIIQLRPVEERRREIVASELKQEVKPGQSAPLPPQVVSQQPAKSSEKPANEQLALIAKRPSESTLEKKPPFRPLPRVLEGYIIQLSFSEKGEAQRWAENLTGRGFAVSMTEAGGNSAFRVRIGNFSGRSEAERQLKMLGQDGLRGVVLNLPQAYRPEVRSPEPNPAEQPISVTP